MDGLVGLPSHLRRRLADALDSGALGPPYTAAALKAVLGMRDGAGEAAAALGRLHELGIGGTAAAAWLRTAGSAAEQLPKPDLVWSGPELEGVPARDTRRVFEELLSTAEKTVWASSYAYFDGRRAFDVLARRMEARPTLNVTLLLNIQRRRGDTTTADDLVRRFADRFWQNDWPGQVRPRVFFDPRSVDSSGPQGVLHAKAIVTDTANVFVTSANFTEAALDHNIELGLLVRDPPLAISVISYFQALIDTGKLSPLPAQ